MNKQPIDIKSLRLAINVIRRAEEDYLNPNIPKKLRASAEQTLFGVEGSLLPEVCRILNMDLQATRMKIIQYKANGIPGDPVFSWLTDPNSLYRQESGELLDKPTLEALMKEGNECQKNGC